MKEPAMPRLLREKLVVAAAAFQKRTLALWLAHFLQLLS
jgi:hypothetical protein